jgi:hypothetical protein
MAPDDVAVDLRGLAVLADRDVDERLDGAGVDRPPGADHRQELSHHVDRLLYAGVVAAQPQLVAAQGHLTAQGAFEDLEVSVVLARQGERLGVVAELDRSLCHRLPCLTRVATVSRPAGCGPAG